MEINNRSIRKISENISILYIDEDLRFLGKLLIFLVKYFQDLDCIDNIEKGEQLFLEKTYDIVVFNIPVKENSYIEHCKFFLNHNKDISIIITSQVEDFHFLKNLLNIGISKFILKPFKFKDLFKVIYRESIKQYNKKRSDILKIQQFKKYSFFSEVFDEIPSGIVILNSEKIIIVNKKFLFLAGYSNYDIFKKRVKNITSLFSDPTFKNLSNNEFLKCFKNNSNIEVTINNKKYFVESVYLSKFSYYLLNFIYLKNYDNTISSLKNRLFRSKITELYNIEYFRDKFNLIKRTSEEHIIIIFSIQNLKSITRFLGRRNVLKVIKKVISHILFEIRDKKIEDRIFLLDFGYNKYVLISDKDSFFKAKNIIEENNPLEFDISMDFQDGDKKIVPVKIKFSYDFFDFDKNLNIEEIIGKIFEKFDEFD